MTERTPVVLFLVDGMRPDGLTQAATPTLDALRQTGSYTLAAQTVMPSMTLPCHTSLFFGVAPTRHGITTNVWTPQVRPIPGLFDVLAQADRVTASFYNWEELRDLAQPGSLNMSVMIKSVTYDTAADGEVAQVAAHWLGNHAFDFAFVYLGGTDLVGHIYGWMSDPYLQAIADADRHIQTVLDALPEGCTVLVTSDHGGHDQLHGTDCAEDMTIPLLLRGPAVPSGQTIEQPVTILDIAPTIAALLGVKAPAEWVGSPVIAV